MEELMEDEIRKQYTGQGLGIAGLVLAIIALIISFIPCLGVYALLPGIIAIVFSAIGFSMATKSNAKKSMLIAALVISIVGSLIAGWQFYVFRNAPDTIEQIGKEIQKAIEENDDEEEDEDIMKGLEESMEELEGPIVGTENDSIQKDEGAISEKNKIKEDK